MGTTSPRCGGIVRTCPSLNNHWELYHREISNGNHHANLHRLYGGFLIIAQTALALCVGGFRGRNQNPIGDADDEVLARRIRRHGNMTEYAPIYISILALYELMMGQTTAVFCMTLLFAIARVLHMIGFSASAGSHLQNLSGNLGYFVLFRIAGAGLTLLLSFAIGLMLFLALSAL